METQSPEDVLIAPLSLDQRKTRGFCTCPLKKPEAAAAAPAPALAPDGEPCPVHPKHVQQTTNYLQANGLVFFDDRRNRFVTWADAVEGMRQPRYAGASSKALVLFTWMNLVHLLEALRYPDRATPAEVTESFARELVDWAGRTFPPEVLRSLIGFARGGGTEALCKIFQTVARNAQERAGQGKGTP